MLTGNVPLRDLTAQDVRRTLSKLAQTRSTRTMASTHNVLVRAIRHAKTEKSRRTLALPQSAVAALREHRKWQASSRLAAGPLCGWWGGALVWSRRWIQSGFQSWQG